MSSVLVVGVDHRSVPSQLFEQLAVPGDDLPKALTELAGREEVSEAVIVSTCMRTEAYVVADRFHAAMAELRDFFAWRSGLAVEELADQLYSFHDESAVEHLFKVASGLESAVLGEGEVLGQVARAWDQAREEGACGAHLSRLFRHAVEVGKRARSETGIARGTASISHAAVELGLREVAGAAGAAVIVGAGDMGRGMARSLRRMLPEARLVVVSRSHERGNELADEVKATWRPLTSLAAELAEAEIVFCCTGAAGMVLHAEEVVQIAKRRAHKRLIIVDVAVPRDVDPSVRDLPGIQLLDMNELREFAEIGMSARREEVVRVDQIVAEEVERYFSLATAREAAPVIAALRRHAADIRREELQRYEHRLASLDPREREAVNALTESILGKLLHDPTVQLKDAAGTPSGRRWADALRALFRLEH